jgi:hypothetical protein
MRCEGSVVYFLTSVDEPELSLELLELIFIHGSWFDNAERHVRRLQPETGLVHLWPFAKSNFFFREHHV